MNIEDLTIKQAREIASLLGTPPSNPHTSGTTSPWRVGETYLIRTATMTLTGRLLYVGEHELLLQEASWIADTGRFSDALKDGALSEVEPFPNEAIVGRGAIIDAAIWEHPLPREQK
jgi:hypothetical protein